jgi:hypothetical protein
MFPWEKQPEQRGLSPLVLSSSAWAVVTRCSLLTDYGVCLEKRVYIERLCRVAGNGPSNTIVKPSLLVTHPAAFGIRHQYRVW